MGEDSKEKGDGVERDLPGGLSNLSHILGVQQREDKLPWLAGRPLGLPHWDKRVMGSLDSRSE